MKNLDIAWAIGFPGQGGGTGASIVGDTMFVTGGGKLLALDTAPGVVSTRFEMGSKSVMGS